MTILRDKMDSFVWLMGVCFVLCGFGWFWFDWFVSFVLERYMVVKEMLWEIFVFFAISGQAFVFCVLFSCSVFCFCVLYP
jgi:F0F1-type ATP synthase membrane subunit a